MFRLRQKPVKWKPDTRDINISIPWQIEYDQIPKIIKEWYDSWDIKDHYILDDDTIKKGKFNTDGTGYDYYEEVPTFHILITLQPSQILFEKAEEDYQENLSSYNTWYNANKDKIEQELERRALEEENKKNDKLTIISKQEEKLKKQLADIQKKKKTLEK